METRIVNVDGHKVEVELKIVNFAELQAQLETRNALADAADAAREEAARIRCLANAFRL